VPGFTWAALFATGSALKHLKLLQLAATSPRPPALEALRPPRLRDLLPGVEPSRW
jgi:hypothetical protein